MPLDAANEYNALKERYPDVLVGYEQYRNFEFYGEDGILRGYVPFDKDWTGFSAEEYREASESVMKEPDVTVTADVKKRLDLTGYEIVRVQYFSTMQNPAMTISNGRLRFNTACLKKFENVEYVELLLNSVERCIAIRPCDKNNPNAIRWGRLKEGRWCASTLGCRGLAKTLFDIMEWDEDLRYRFRGQFLEQGDNKMMLFAFDEPEMIKVEEIVLPPKENTEEDEGETVKKKIYIFPPEWAGTFGQPITSIAQVGILRQEHYAGNWDVFRPATEIEEMNIFTAESLNELLREAEKIMEGSNSGEIKCMALVRMIYGDSGWDKKMSYRLIGRAFPQQRLVSFKITDAMQIENGRVLTEM